ncbi:EAL domain-containing protein [Thiobacillus sp.]|uniref:EAL domain-containing protein n=1 Tax=Thiobacillus sp. TaxID=924 RepID=UPI00286DB52F|nr:EAL domain-containing protein [Thiobacillus sp.]
MNEHMGVRATRYSLTANILGAVFALILLMYLVTLIGLGFSLRERAQKNLELATERELSAFMTVIQDQVLLRDYPAIEQLIAARTRHEHILLARFVSPGFSYEARTPSVHPTSPAWFSLMLDLPAPLAESDVKVGGSNYGRMSVMLDPTPSVQGLWSLTVRFTWLVIIGLAVSMLLLNWLLGRNRRGLAALREAARAIETGNLRARVSLAHGSSPEVRETKLAFNHMADHVSQLVSALESEHADLLVEKERLRVTIESIGDAVIVTDSRGLIEFINPKAEELTGYSSSHARGRPVSEVLPLFNEDSGAPVTNPLELALRGNQVVELASHSVIVRPSGATLAISDTAAPIRSREGKVLGGVLVFHDESEMRRLMQRLAQQAERDHLTGLWNRRAMENRLVAALQGVQQKGQRYIFCYIDLDRFKLVNDTCGHRAGDALLQRLTALLARRAESEQHFLARLGGDEFGLLFVDTTLPAALEYIQGMRDEIDRFRFEWDEKVFRLGVSIGVTELHSGMTDIGEILAQADTACYHAKSLGGSMIQVYEKTHPALQKISDEMQWVSAITKAFEAHRFVLYRQQKVALAPGIAQPHYEILLRLRGEDGVIISPGEFLPAAERYGLAPSFDRWVVRNLFAYLDTHPEDQAWYALNLSGRSLSDQGTADFVLEELDRYKLDPARISFEVTETAAIDNLDACERLILTLQSRGIQFALDDFGKGQSSLGYLKRLPAAYLKLDGDFVRGLDHNRENLAIVKAMHTLAHELGKQTVAEQVETQGELGCLKTLGVDFVQGYLLHRPELLQMD